MYLYLYVCVCPCLFVYVSVCGSFGSPTIGLRCFRLEQLIDFCLIEYVTRATLGFALWKAQVRLPDTGSNMCCVKTANTCLTYMKYAPLFRISKSV